MDIIFHEILKKWWGYDSFRPSQLDVIRSIYNGVDTMALMPTGAGKSLLYQVPALAKEGICVVITPLISLMKDQVDRLRSIGIAATAIHSGMTTRQIDIALDNCVWGDIKLLYVSPERVAGDTFRTRFKTMNISLIAVDEAHCISQWGYDFRPSYLKIARLRELSDAPILALTASATPQVAKDIMTQLAFRQGNIFRTTFLRKNLSFSVRHVEDKEQQLLRVIDNVKGSGIVYVRTRNAAQMLALKLSEKGYSADFYHAGMGHAERSLKQDLWQKGRTRIVVATNAFGMGIDKADVRFVIHFDICDSLEAYYQEGGRAGRDGKRSYAVLLASPDDRARMVKRFENEYPAMDKIKECYESLFNYIGVGIGDGKFAVFSFNIFDFAAKSKIYSGTVLNAIKILQMNGYITLTDEADNPARIMFLVGREDLYKIRVEREELDHILRIILRLYNGLFNGNFVSIDEQEIAQFSGYEQKRVHELLKKLWQLHIIKYIPANRSPLLLLNEERLPIADVYISPDTYQRRKEIAVERIESMLRYAGNMDDCRSIFISSYFGEQAPVACGCCDVCLKKKKAAYEADNDLESLILNHVKGNSFTVKEIASQIGGEVEKVIKCIDWLLAKGKIIIGPGGKVTGK